LDRTEVAKQDAIELKAIRQQVEAEKKAAEEASAKK
jgi:hypothetical protein